MWLWIWAVRNCRKLWHPIPSSLSLFCPFCTNWPYDHPSLRSCWQAVIKFKQAKKEREEGRGSHNFWTIFYSPPKSQMHGVTFHFPRLIFWLQNFSLLLFFSFFLSFFYLSFILLFKFKFKHLLSSNNRTYMTFLTD